MEKDDTYSEEGYRRRKKWIKETREDKIGEYPASVPASSQTEFLDMEVKTNYINAQFLSTIVVAGAVIEEMLVSQIRFVDKEKKEQRMTLGDALENAVELDIISEEVTDSFEELSDIADLRNAVVHYREGHEDPIFKDSMEKFGDYHPNKHGKEFAERMIEAMLDIKSKYLENQNKVYDGEGPLTQGITNHKHGEEVYCPECGENLKDRELEYEAKWNGSNVEKEIMECPECGFNVAPVIREKTG